MHDSQYVSPGFVLRGVTPPRYPVIAQVNVYPDSAVYINPLVLVGKKFILLLACSILNVYKGVLNICGLAATHAAAKSIIATPAATTDIFFVLSISLSPLFDFYAIYSKL
jgi:hypothetical protein